MEDLKSLVGVVKDAVLKFPQPAAWEPTRIYTMRTAKITDMDPGAAKEPC